MNTNEKRAFCQLLNDLADYYDKPIKDAALMIYWNALEHYSLAQVKQALSDHVKDPKTGQYMPKVADLISQIQKTQPGRLSADEAWPMVSQGEDATLIVPEIALQTRGLVADLYHSGDKIGARMAFKAAYERLQGEASQAGQPERWVVSLGTCPHQRQTAIEEGVRLGRISAERAQVLLPDLNFNTGKILPTPQAQEQIRRLRLTLDNAIAQNEDQRAASAERKRQAEEQHRQTVLDQLKTKTGEEI